MAVQFNEAVYSDSGLFFVLSELGDTIKLNLDVEFLGTSHEMSA